MCTEDERSVMVVDDEVDIRETLREAIEMAGCKALLAANGADALAILAHHRPCVVILDLAMPVMTGQELLEILQRDPAFATLQIVVSTSTPRRAPPGVAVLPKPIDLSAFWDSIHQNCRCALPLA
jgi:CheY-like chemotaxis protein